MKRPTLFSGILAALAIAGVAAIMFPLVRALFGWQTDSQVMIALVSLLYGGYLLSTAESRVGKSVLGLVGLGISFASIAGTTGLLTTLALQGLWIWGVRSICFQRTSMGIGLDGVLLMLGAGVGLLVLGWTQTVFLPVWSALLVQSLFIWIPVTYGHRQQPQITNPTKPSFDRNRRIAEAAIKQIAVS